MLRPHAARYTFFNPAGEASGHEEMRISRRARGWLVTASLVLDSPADSHTEVEWLLNPDLSTHVLYLSTTDQWGDEYGLEAAVTGNGLLASRTAPDGPTQVEMGWGAEVELDHLCACFTTVMLGRWDMHGTPARRVTSVYIGAEDLVPEPLAQEYRALRGAAGSIEVERHTPSTGASATISVATGGVVEGYEGLFRLAGAPTFLD